MMLFRKSTTIAAAMAIALTVTATTVTAGGTLQTGDLGVTITGSPTTVSPGGTVTYTVQVSNPGPSAVNNVNLNLVFASDLDTITVVSDDPYVCAPPSGGDVDCTISTHPTAVTATLTITARVVPGAVDGAVLQVSAAVSALNFTDTNAGNDRASASVTVAVSPATTSTTAAPTTSGPTTTAVGGGAGSATTVAPSIPTTGSGMTDLWLLAAVLLLVVGAGTMWIVRRPAPSTD
jgi:uncharacterized repeat protein (TIGR01451 family)